MAKIIPIDQARNEVTVCTKCVHFQNLEPNSSRKDCWYNHLCRATLLPIKIDPYDGKEKPYSVNDLGQECFSEDTFDYCRNINDGACPKFKIILSCASGAEEQGS